ncbi:unnamed protein product [Callosobruchus maculatus]|uniref:Uncharacterized protein n=1 Tax=Callosobruchus maculatus TaxID=64391 RepID=A0A653DWB8_CALMS|nr:unnamed protein product [Callosobruchus maculatus]
METYPSRPSWESSLVRR